MKKVLTLIISILFLLIMLFVFSGCSPSDGIRIPVKDSDAEDMLVDDVVKEYKKAGFTNITTEPEKDIGYARSMSDHYFTSDLNKVSSISIDDDYTSSFKRYSPDASIVIKYHDLKYPTITKREGLTELQSLFLEAIENRYDTPQILSMAEYAGLHIIIETVLNDRIYIAEGPGELMDGAEERYKIKSDRFELEYPYDKDHSQYDEGSCPNRITLFKYGGDHITYYFETGQTSTYNKDFASLEDGIKYLLNS